MSLLLAVAGGVWALAMTVALLAAIRQISLISVRLDLQMRLPDLSEMGDGPDAGMEVSIAALDEFGSDLVVLALAGSCASCRRFVESLPDESALPVALVVLLAGRGAPTRELAAQFPTWVSVIRDPQATAIGRELELSRTLVALQLQERQITGKADITTIDDLLSLVTASEVHSPTRRVDDRRS